MEPILQISGKSDSEIATIFQEYSVALTPDEGRQVLQMLGRNPTLTEATIWGIQGSEHSSYKSSREYLKQLPTKGKHILLGPGEDAGVVRFHESATGEIYGIVFAHESHNHPSQVVPYEGAATGVGGICRDIACMGARVIGALDALRFGDLALNNTKRIAAGVVAGVGGYGNPLGVPNLGGDMFFEESFNDNCLVNVVALGVLKWKNLIHSYVPKNAAADGYDFILVGKPTDRSGFGGSYFASATLNEDDRDKNKGAVQEPNPFLERHLFAAFDDLFQRLEESGDLGRIALKDLGAGGILCATVELVAELGFGAEIDVEKIHKAEENLPTSIILCAETQERFCFAVPPDLSDFILEHFNTRWDFPNVSVGAKASKIGKVVPGGRYTAQYGNETVCDAKALDITRGIMVDRPLQKLDHHGGAVVVSKDVELEDLFRILITSENICSKRPFTETYDQTVQGNTKLTRDEADAAVFTPLADFNELSEIEQNLCAIVSVAGPARIGRISPEAQAKLAVSQAVLKVAAVGGKTLSLTDCLNYGNPEIPAQMYQFKEGIDGLVAAADTLETPFVSGNVSLYNCSPKGSVSPSAIIGALGKMETAIMPRRNAFSGTEKILVLLGELSGKLGGSEVARLMGNQLGSEIPPVDLHLVKNLAELLTDSSLQINAASIIAEGGLAAALMKMSARSGIGVDADHKLRLEQWFSEDLGVLVEVDEISLPILQKRADQQGIPYSQIGVTRGEEFLIQGKSFISVAELSDFYQNSLRHKK